MTLIEFTFDVSVTSKTLIFPNRDFLINVIQSTFFYVRSKIKKKIQSISPTDRMRSKMGAHKTKTSLRWGKMIDNRTFF